MNNNKRRNRSNKKGNSNRRGNKNMNTELKREDFDTNCEGSNDPSWYAGSPEILRDVASLSYFVPTGGTFSLDEKARPYAASIVEDQSIPGFMAIDIVHGPGKCEFQTDAANVASRILYTQINSMNSRNKSYDPSDLFLDILAVDEMYGFISWCKRIYGLINTYSVYNKYYPKEVIKAMGVNFDDLIQHMPDFRTMINNWILQLSTFVTPESWNYLKRHQFLYSYVYADSPSAKAQTYAFCPFGFRKYVETEGPGKLVMKPLQPPRDSTTDEVIHGLNITEIYEYGTELINAIALSQDCTTMTADIIKATNAYMKEDMLQPDYCVTPVYVPEVLMQIENATINTWLWPKGNGRTFLDQGYDGRFDITTTADGKVVYKLEGKVLGTSNEDMYLYQLPKLLNMRQDGATPEMNMVATRLMNGVESHGGTDYVVHSFGTEVAINCRIFNFVQGADFVYAKEFGKIGFAYTIKSVDELPEVFERIHLLNQFAWHPCMNVTISPIDAGDKHISGGGIRLMETDNMTVVNKEDLKKLHEAALLGEFQIGQPVVRTK